MTRFFNISNFKSLCFKRIRYNIDKLTGGDYMTATEKIIKEIEILSEQERQQIYDKIKQRDMSSAVVSLGDNQSWWDNEEDDIYNE